jgi:hypothetical protein
MDHGLANDKVFNNEHIAGALDEIVYALADGDINEDKLDEIGHEFQATVDRLL